MAENCPAAELRTKRIQLSLPFKNNGGSDLANPPHVSVLHDKLMLKRQER